ncbi:MAG TPA: RDD family protein, partial [Propionicimonas sp.]|nr:RDD family protein [Propionicimonas sp.]
YLGYKSGTTGVTFGRSIAKTKLISEETGQPIGSTNGIIRQFAHIVDSVICYIGWLFPLWDAKRQTIADKIMKTVVVDNSTDPNAGNYNWNL